MGLATRTDTPITLEDRAGARLLVSEMSVALLLLDEARYRVVKRLFGVSRDQSWVVTLIALAALAQAAHDKSDQMLRGPGGPTRADVMLGAAALRELLAGIPGPSSRERLVATLVTTRGGGSPGPPRTETDGPRHQDLLTPSPAVVQSPPQSSSARQGDQRHGENAR